MTCYFFVDGDGTENVSNKPPLRHPSENFWIVLKDNTYYDNQQLTNKSLVEKIIDYNSIVEIPRNTIKTLFGKSITWNDVPIKITIKN